MKYRVLYASLGVLSGHEPGDVVEIASDDDARHLQDLDLIEPHIKKAPPPPPKDPPPAKPPVTKVNLTQKGKPDAGQPS